MRSVLVALLPICALPAPVFAQVSGEVGIYSQYLDDDLLPLTPDPVVQAGVSVDISQHCSADAWVNLGINTRVGRELDLGASCRFDIDETQIEVVASRYLLQAESDITELSVSATQGSADVTVSYYAWDDHPDAVRVTVGYTIEATDKLLLRPAAVYQTGFGDSDVIGAGLYANYRLTDNLEVVGMALAPIKGDRHPQVSLGLKFSF